MNTAWQKITAFIKARMSIWIIVSFALLVALALTAPHLPPVSLYKLSLITTAAWVAYWIDRSLFPYARPDGYLNTDDWRRSQAANGKSICSADFTVADGYQIVFALAMLRRALIIAAAMIGVALGA